ncbi:Phage-related protein [Deinococcus reticulitermitis]|uniref:Phage-related protein n=1 Tax=Deinococcus reticulitermitis TaxID=856736 RepID=A0A1H7BP21_9DEIO|nr:type II toxin-antitoxin system RelE/ParE family toxin [Deinococcus reticulitermitis]SEJ79473.1 Phage-related protein [Deinococcus reticulitermitis]
MSDRELLWVGSSKQALLDMPEEVRREFGFVLRAVQQGQEHPSIKTWTGAAGVYEIRVNDPDSTYRTVYVANLPDAIYVLHAFQKKSMKGIKTSQRDKDMVRDGLGAARDHSRQVMAARATQAAPKRKEKKK